MENRPKLSHHEAMELHELMNNYMVGIKHINAEISKVEDEDLKNFMEDNVNNKVTKLQEINDFFNNGDQQQSEDNNQDQGQYGSQNENSGEEQESDQSKYQYQYQSTQHSSYSGNSSSGSGSSGGSGS